MAERKTIDPRFKPFVEILKREWDNNCKELDFAFSPADGRVLNIVLSKHKNLTAEKFLRCVSNRINSEGIPLCQRPCTYLADILKYYESPLDRFGKVKQQKAAWM